MVNIYTRALTFEILHQGQRKRILADEWEEVVTLDHGKLRVEALCRYDNPGSITVHILKSTLCIDFDILNAPGH
jgi:hypothetical protein